MANPHRGEVALQVGDQTYTLSYSVNAICDLEDALDMPIGRITQALDDPLNVSMKTIRALVWAGLQERHPDVDGKKAGLLISECGVQETVDRIGEAFQLAFPQQNATGPEANGAARPPKAKGRAHLTS